MPVEDADEFVAFPDVRLVRVVAQALFCRIGARRVWLPRGHVAGRLFRHGDRGTLLIRRWVARDRHLIDRHGAAISSPVPSRPRSRSRAHLHVVHRDLAVGFAQ